MDGGIRALFVLLLCILEDGNLNLAEYAEVKLASQIVLTVLVRLLPNSPEWLFIKFY